MDYQERFSDNDLAKIVNEGMVSMCACPAQVAASLRTLRNLYLYQMNCLEQPGNESLVHTTIAQAAIVTHSLLEDCMEKILEIEKWDRASLQMPPNLRKRQIEEINKEYSPLKAPGA